MGESSRRRVISSRKLLIAALWLLVLGFGGWALRELPWTAMVASVKALSTAQWVVWVAINTAIILLLTLRWQWLAKSTHTVDFWNLFLIRQAGQTLSLITPGPQFGGEPFQLYWLSRRHQVSLHHAMLALGLDRFFEVTVNFAVLLLGVFVLLLSAREDVATWYGIAAVLAVFLAGMAMLGWVLIRQPQWLSWQWQQNGIQRWRKHAIVQRIEHYWKEFQRDLRFTIAKEKRRLASAVMISLLVWMGLLGELALLLGFLDISIGAFDFVLLMVAMRLALLLPIPAGIGSLEASVLWSFQHIGLPLSAAMGLIALFRLRDVILLLVGFACLRALQSEPAQAAS